MRLPLAAACMLVVAPAFPGEVLFPAVLLGEWDTDTANCTPSPITGHHAWFTEDRGGGATLAGGSCSINAVSSVGRDLLLTASCWMEKAAMQRPAHLIGTIQADGAELVLQSDWMETGSLTFRRCTPEEIYNNTPLDIGFGN